MDLPVMENGKTMITGRHLALGTLLLVFVLPVLAAAPGDLIFERKGQGENKNESIVFPPSIFQHWRHRINYRCDACHNSLFEMKLGATTITMDLMGQGKVCGACHNGDAAFDTGFSNCARCHRPPPD